MIRGRGSRRLRRRPPAPGSVPWSLSAPVRRSLSARACRVVDWTKDADFPERPRSIADDGDPEGPLLCGDDRRRPGLPALRARRGRSASSAATSCSTSCSSSAGPSSSGRGSRPRASFADQRNSAFSSFASRTAGLGQPLARGSARRTPRSRGRGRRRWRAGPGAAGVMIGLPGVVQALVAQSSTSPLRPRLDVLGGDQRRLDPLDPGALVAVDVR